MKQMKWISTLIGLVGLISLSACSTMEGFGRDVQKVGEKIETAATKK